jgi:hypothetical protein
MLAVVSRRTRHALHARRDLVEQLWPFRARAECGERAYDGGGLYTAEESDGRHCRLLRARGERPCGRRPAEKRNELTSPHICTQAHGNSIVSALSKSPDAIRRIAEIGLEK